MNEREIVETLARMTTDAEMGGNMSGDDAVTTLSRMIEEARTCIAMGRDVPCWPKPDLPPPAPGDSVFVIVVHPDMTASQAHNASGPAHAAAGSALRFSMMQRLVEDGGRAPPPSLAMALRFLVALAEMKPEAMQ